jgi:hypothetical protein
VAQVLINAGYRVIVQEFNFAVGDNAAEKMHDALKRTKHLIVLYSKTYEQSGFTKIELFNFIAAAANSGGKRRLIVLRVEDCKPRGIISGYIYGDLFGRKGPSKRREIILAAAEGRALAHADTQNVAQQHSVVQGPKRFTAKRRSEDRADDRLGRVGVPRSLLTKQDVLNPKKFSAFLRRTEQFVLDDQIDESGGWPRSWARVYEYNTKEPPNPEVRREGGIISTYMAIRGLAAIRPKLTTFEAPGHDAYKYLIQRQGGDHGFGRMVRARSNYQILSHLRHTALAVLALVLLDGPIDKIALGYQYLGGLTPEKLENDSTRAIAIAATIHAAEFAAESEWAAARLPRTMRQRMATLLDQHKERLLQTIESECKDPQKGYAPLWVPYGKFAPMVYMSALLMVDFLTLWKRPPWHIIDPAISHLASRRKGGALPYDPSCSTPDLGVSSYFAVVCFRPEVRQHLIETKQTDVLDAARACLNFCSENYASKVARKHVFGDTMSSALLLQYTDIN